MDVELEANYAKRFEEFKKHPAYSEEFLDLLNYYVRNFIFLPTKSDQMFWNVTCLNPGGYNKPYNLLQAMMRVNIHMPEVFTVIYNNAYDEAPELLFNFHAAADQLTEDDAERFEIEWGVPTNPGNYAATGGKQVQCGTRSIEIAWKLLHDPAFQRALKVSNLRLMRQGLLARRLSQSHCLPLAQAALARKL